MSHIYAEAPAGTSTALFDPIHLTEIRNLNDLLEKHL